VQCGGHPKHEETGGRKIVGSEFQGQRIVFGADNFKCSNIPKLFLDKPVFLISLLQVLVIVTRQLEAEPGVGRAFTAKLAVLDLLDYVFQHSP